MPVSARYICNCCGSDINPPPAEEVLSGETSFSIKCGKCNHYVYFLNVPEAAQSERKEIFKNLIERIERLENCLGLEPLNFD